MLNKFGVENGVMQKCALISSRYPTNKDEKNGSSVGKYTLPMSLSVFGTVSYTQSALINKILPKFCSKKLGSTFRSLVGVC